MITLTFPDGNARQVEAGTTAAQVAAQISKSLEKKAVAAMVNGVLVDLADPIAADASLRIADMGYARLLVGNPVRRHICVMLRDGTRIVRKVTGAATGNPGEEVISVESAWGVDAEPADIARVCWWLRLRANADAIEVQHIRAGVATCAVPVIEIRDEV